jgi:hypothetical protein
MLNELLLKVCDNFGTYIELHVRFKRGAWGAITAKPCKVKDSSCAGSSNVVETCPTYTAPDNLKILDVEVYVCRSDGGADTCYHEGRIKNPYF